jgi:hypothetical protein
MSRQTLVRMLIPVEDVPVGNDLVNLSERRSVLDQMNREPCYICKLVALSLHAGTALSLAVILAPYCVAADAAVAFPAVVTVDREGRRAPRPGASASPFAGGGHDCRLGAGAAIVLGVPRPACRMSSLWLMFRSELCGQRNPPGQPGIRSVDTLHRGNNTWVGRASCETCSGR